MLQMPTGFFPTLFKIITVTTFVTVTRRTRKRKQKNQKANIGLLLFKTIIRFLKIKQSQKFNTYIYLYVKLHDI